LETVEHKVNPRIEEALAALAALSPTPATPTETPVAPTETPTAATPA
jgi:hypothetical protein